MHLIISMPNGKRREAVVLAVGENRLRVVLAGHNDIVELRRQYGLWASDVGEIEVAAMTAYDRIDINRLCADFRPEERAVGLERLEGARNTCCS